MDHIHDIYQNIHESKCCLHFCNNNKEDTNLVKDQGGKEDTYLTRDQGGWDVYRYAPSGFFLHL